MASNDTIKPTMITGTCSTTASLNDKKRKCREQRAQQYRKQKAIKMVTKAAREKYKRMEDAAERMRKSRAKAAHIKQ